MKTFVNIVWIAVLLTGVVFTSQRMARYGLSRPELLSLPPLVTMKTPVTNIMTLGHKGLYDDFISIWALQILASPDVRSIPPELLQKKMLVITRHLPKLETIYLLMIFTIALDLNRPDLTLPIALDGLRAFPQSWRIPMTEGFVYSFILDQPVRAAAFYSLAASRENSPAYVSKLVDKLLSRGPIKEQDAQSSLDELTDMPGGQKFREILSRHLQKDAQ